MSVDPQSIDIPYEQPSAGLACGTVVLFAVVVTGYAALWLAAALELMPLPLTSVPATILAYLSFTVMHDAGHGSLAQGEQRYLVIERTIGWVASIPFLIVPFSFFTRIHDHHHAFTNHPDKDPDQWVSGANLWQALPQALTLLPHYAYHGLVRLRHDHNMRASWPSSTIYWLAMATVMVAMVAQGYGAELWWLLVLPMCAASVLLALLFDWVPHRPNLHQGRYQNTRIYLGFGLRWLTLGQNYHLIHHLYPKLPWYRYRQVFEQIRPQLEQQQANIDQISGLRKPFSLSHPSTNAVLTGVVITIPLVKRYRVCVDAIELSFDLSGVDGFDFAAGQYITLSTQIDNTTVTRSYSIVSPPGAHSLAIAVKRKDGGLLSCYLHDHARIGMRFTIAGPYGDFVLPSALETGSASTSVDLLLVAVGSGITPMLTLITTALECYRGKISLLVSHRATANGLYMKQLDRLVQHHPQRLHITTVWTEQRNRIGCTDIEFAAKGMLIDKCHAYVCGPAALQQLCINVWTAMGLAAERQHCETFELPMDAPQGERHQVVVTLRNGCRHQLTVAENQTVLGVARAQGIDLPSACGNGHCGSCLVQKQQGDDVLLAPNCAGLLVNERQQGKTLLCQCQPRTNLLLSEL